MHKLIGAATLAAAALAAVPQATAQITAPLAGVWACTLMTGSDTGGAVFTYHDNSSWLGYWVQVIPVDSGVTHLTLSIGGTWKLADGTLTSTVTSLEVLEAALNGDPVTDAVFRELENGLEGDPASFSGDSQVTRLDTNTLEMVEPDASISCRR